jgi:hypothetical protein
MLQLTEEDRNQKVPLQGQFFFAPALLSTYTWIEQFTVQAGKPRPYENTWIEQFSGI